MIHAELWRRVMSYSDHTDYESEFIWLPLPAVVSVWGFVAAIAHLATKTFTEYAISWWMYPLLFIAALAGTYAPLFREAALLQVGRFFAGAGWLFIPIALGGAIGLLRGNGAFTYLLYSGVFPGVFLLTSYAAATMLGDIIATMFPVSELKSAYGDEALALRAQKTWQHIVRFVFKKWMFLAFLATALVEGVFGISIALTWAAVLWASVGFLASFIMLTAVHIVMKRRAWEAEKERLRVARAPMGGHRFSYGLLAIATLAALVLPANISPLARHGMGTMFSRLSDIVAPLVIPTERRRQSTANKGEWAEALRLRMTAFFENDTVAGVFQYAGGPVRLGILVILIGAAVFATWRLYQWLRFGPKKGRSGTRYVQSGLLSEFIFWLRERMHSVFRILFGAWRDALGRLSRGESERGKTSVKKRSDNDHPQATSVGRFTDLFLAFLRRLQRLGYVREPSETPKEFAERIGQIQPDTAEELMHVTDLYSQVRYRPGWDKPFLQRTYEQFDQSIRRVLKVIQRKSEGQQQASSRRVT